MKTRALGVLAFAALGALPARGDDGAQCVFQKVPRMMIAGRRYQILFTMKNTGDRAWTEASRYRLGLLGAEKPDIDVWGVDHVLLKAGEAVPPGAEHRFFFPLTAPSESGIYGFQWRMVQAWVDWFGSPTPELRVAVQASKSAAKGSPQYLFDQAVRSYGRSDLPGALRLLKQAQALDPDDRRISSTLSLVQQELGQ